MPKISLAEPVTQLRHIRIVENNDPLVDFKNLTPALILDRPRFNYRHETFLRAEVAKRLKRAAESMPKGYRIAILEGWRAPHIQRRMYAASWKRFEERHPDWSPTQLKRVVNRFTAPMDSRVPPPHTTGGAMDVFLVNDEGVPYDMNSPYERYDHRGFPLHAPGLAEETLRNREILSSALINAGITNYPSEFWHYSYGDQGWAYRGGHDHALYQAITPKDWEPFADDVSEEPLVFRTDV